MIVQTVPPSSQIVSFLDRKIAPEHPPQIVPFLDHEVVPERLNPGVYARFVSAKTKDWSLRKIELLNAALWAIQIGAVCYLHFRVVFPRVTALWLRNCSSWIVEIVSTIFFSFQSKIIFGVCSFFTKELKRVEIEKVQKKLKSFVKRLASDHNIRKLSAERIHGIHFNRIKPWHTKIVETQEGEKREVYTGPLDKIMLLKTSRTVAVGVDEIGRSVISLRLEDTKYEEQFRVVICLSEQSHEVYFSEEQFLFRSLPFFRIFPFFYSFENFLNQLELGKHPLFSLDRIPFKELPFKELPTIHEESVYEEPVDDQSETSS